MPHNLLAAFTGFGFKHHTHTHTQLHHDLAVSEALFPLVIWVTVCYGWQVEEVDPLTDPCPLPSTLKKRGLNEKERVLYAPMADVGGLLYDKDAVYIDIPDWKVHAHSHSLGIHACAILDDLLYTLVEDHADEDWLPLLPSPGAIPPG